MKVKAKWAIKVNGVWRKTGDVFDVDSTAGLLGAVEVLKEEPKPAKTKAEKVPDVKEEPEQKPEAKDEPKPKTETRTRKKTTGK